MCYVHNQWYDISCATLYVEVCALFHFLSDFFPGEHPPVVIQQTAGCAPELVWTPSRTEKSVSL